MRSDGSWVNHLSQEGALAPGPSPAPLLPVLLGPPLSSPPGMSSSSRLALDGTGLSRLFPLWADVFFKGSWNQPPADADGRLSFGGSQKLYGDFQLCGHQRL